MEAYTRNQTLINLHGKLPSYAIWTEEDLCYMSDPEKRQWWCEVEKVRISTDNKDEDLKKTIKKWIDIYTPINEYCGKRSGGDCDL